MDIRHLESLVWISRLGSFSKAGEMLFLTQPTVSAHITNLEKELGKKLINRTTKEVSLTEEGKCLATYGEEILKLKDQALIAIKSTPSKYNNIMELLENSIKDKKVISMVGAGGKTTYMFALAGLLAESGKKVAISTTTKMYYPDISQCRCVITDTDLGKIKSGLDIYGLITVGVNAEENKISAPADEVLRYLQSNADYLIIESDGSKSLPIKMVASYEPVIYDGTDLIIAVSGMSCIGKPLREVCHRYQNASEVLNCDSKHIVTTSDMVKLSLKSYGANKIATIYAINQADNNHLTQHAKAAAEIIHKACGAEVLITSFVSKQFNKYMD